MFYLLLALVISIAVYFGLRAIRANAHRPPTRVIGPDDDPDFLWRLGQGDNTPL